MSKQAIEITAQLIVALTAWPACIVAIGYMFRPKKDSK
jgi:hypothetical protein